MTIIVRRPWTRQPQYPALLVPLDRGCRSLLTYNGGTLFAGSGTVFSNAEQRATLGGVGISTNGSSTSYTEFQDSFAELSGPITIVIAFVKTNLSANGTAFSCSANVGGDWLNSLFLFSVTTAGKLQLGRTGATGTSNRCWMITSEAPIKAQTLHTAVAISNASTVSEHATNTSFWLDGRKLTTTVGFNGGGTDAISSVGSAKIRIGGSVTNVTSEPFGGNVLFARIIAGAVSDPLARRLSTGIGASFMNRRILIPSVVAAATAVPSITAVSVLTSSSAAVSGNVTLDFP